VKISEYFDAGIPFIAENMIRVREGAEKVLLTGPGAPMACRDFSGFFPGEILCSSERRGYAGNMLDIAISNGILTDKGEEEFYSGPEYIRKSDAEIRAGITGL
jgi:hypothetical protein